MPRSDVSRTRRPLTLRGTTFVWGSRTFVMGIVNATPDSFSGDGIADDARAAARLAESFVAAGADIIDVGGESTRPGHQPVSEHEEAARVLPAIEAIRSVVDVPISIDTFKPAIATRALELGADMVNCVWGAMPGIAAAAASVHAPLVIMHNRATPDYRDDIVQEVIASLARSAEEAIAAGVARDHVIVDPGIGFGKTPENNIEIMRRLDEFAHALPYPLLIGTSRKSFIGKITGLPVERRVFGTAASVALAVFKGADIVRVHDVADMVPVVQVADALSRAARETAVPRSGSADDDAVPRSRARGSSEPAR
jgi:dihydropteroate synthase